MQGSDKVRMDRLLQNLFEIKGMARTAEGGVGKAVNLLSHISKHQPMGDIRSLPSDGVGSEWGAEEQDQLRVMGARARASSGSGVDVGGMMSREQKLPRVVPLLQSGPDKKSYQFVDDFRREFADMDK